MNQIAELLDATSRFVERFVVLQSRHQLVAITLWIAHTHAIEAADATPYLAVTSPERRAGKTRLIEVCERLVREPLSVAHISEAALFRSIEELTPTLLFDEADAVFGKGANDRNEGLRAVLNAGQRRGSAIRRCVGDGKKQRVEAFSVFCPKLIAGIGRLPDTIYDRSIPIRMVRRDQRTEPVERFRLRQVEPEASDLRQVLTEWAEQTVAELSGAWPEIPAELDDRAADGWEPLLAIADLAGPEWGREVRDAAVSLAKGSAAIEDDSLGVLVLDHVRATFNGHERVSTEDLLRGLIEHDDGPWAEWWGRDVRDGNLKGPAARLSRLLRPFDVKPKVFRDGDTTIRGYQREQLEPVWSRYLPPPENMQHETPLRATTSSVTSFDFSGGTGEETERSHG